MTDMKFSASSALAQDLRSQHIVRAQPSSTESFLPGRAADSYSYAQSNYDSSNTNGMPSDGRYLYHPHPAMAYEYSTYPPAAYDPAHYSPNQPPPPPQRPMPPPNYHPQYPPPPPPHYGVAAQQWTPETWSHYAYPQPPPPPMQDHNLGSGSARPEMNSTVPMDPSRYPAPTRSSESSISGANQPLPNPQPVSSHERSKPQANEPPPPTPPVTSTIDFMKIVDSYRLIIDSSGTFANDAISNAPGRPPPSEAMDKMLASASLSFRMMETALKEVDRKLEDGVATEQNGNTTTPVAPTTAKPSDPPQVHEGQTCLGCKATSTPEWRRGPMGPRTLCNACGLVYAKLIKKRGREARAARANGKSSSKTDPDNMNDVPPLSGEDGGSDDEDDEDEFSADDG